MFGGEVGGSVGFAAAGMSRTHNAHTPPPKKNKYTTHITHAPQLVLSRPDLRLRGGRLLGAVHLADLELLDLRRQARDLLQELLYVVVGGG